jgi:hypothetical protein
MGLSNGGRLTTLRLFHDYPPGETTTIGYDYSSRDATTIADLYWLSGESPKRDTAAKEKPCTLSRCKAKEKPRQRGQGEI